MFDVGLSLKDVIQKFLSHSSCRLCVFNVLMCTCTYKWSVDEMTFIKALCLRAVSVLLLYLNKLKLLVKANFPHFQFNKLSFKSIREFKRFSKSL